MDGTAGVLLEVDDGADLDGAVPDVAVLGGGEHGLQRVDAVGEHHPVALGGGGRRRDWVRVLLLLRGDPPHGNHLQHRLQRPLAFGVIGDGNHTAGGQLHRRRHRAREIS